ncbi:MAG TPA: hypothetical protein VIQ00_05045 [Chitinophagaceae bacterium]|jgi:hypothetical protein
MPVISTAVDLKKAIGQLEAKKIVQEEELKLQARQVMEEMRPGNLLSNTLHQPGVQNTILNAAVALASGYLSKTLLIGGSTGPVKKIAGDILQWGVTAVTGSKLSGFKTKVGQFLRNRKFKK